MINKMCKAQKGRFVSTNMPIFFSSFCFEVEDNEKQDDKITRVLSANHVLIFKSCIQ